MHWLNNCFVKEGHSGGRERGTKRNNKCSSASAPSKCFSPLAPLAVIFTHSAAAPVAFPWHVCFSPKTKDTIMTLQASPRGLLCTSAQKHPPRERPSLPKPPRAGFEAQGCALGGVVARPTGSLHQQQEWSSLSAPPQLLQSRAAARRVRASFVGASDHRLQRYVTAG